MPFVTVQLDTPFSFTFSEATDSVDDAYSGSGNCGDRDYAWYFTNQSTLITWASVAKDTPSADTHTATISPTDSQSGLVKYEPWTFWLGTKYVNYSSHAEHFTQISVKLTAAGCDCSGLGWTNPTRTDESVAVGASATTITVPAATVDESSKSGAGISSCYDDASTNCHTGYTTTLTYTKDGASASQPAFITANADSSELTV